MRIFINILLSIWVAIFLIDNAWSYFANTIQMFAYLKWESFSLLLTTSFYIWIGIFSTVWWTPLYLLFKIWDKKREKFWLWFIIIVPVIMMLICVYLGKYFWPIKVSDSGEIYIRFFPFL